MRPRTYDRSADARILEPLLDAGVSYRAAASELGWSYRRVQSTAAEIRNGAQTETPAAPAAPASTKPAPEAKEAKEPKEKKKPIRIGHIEAIDRPVPRGIVTRVIVTSAQDDTEVFQPFWENLQAYAEAIDASLMVGGYTYQLGLYEDHAVATATYAEELRDYLVFDRVRSGDVLFVSDANVLPTTANPLAGWLTANRGDHVVIPHARVAMQSIPRMQDADPRYCISTGTVTRPSYTPRASGRKALFHHTYGALLIEFDVDGEMFPRHLLADEDGSFQDLTTFVSGGTVHPNCRVKGIAWGDFHHKQLEPGVAMASWGYDTSDGSFLPYAESSVVDDLQPEYQVAHDTLDFKNRNHHDLHDPHRMAQVHASGSGNVEEEVALAAAFVAGLRREWSKIVVVESNHDTALARWLKNHEGSEDPENAEYWHRMNADWHRAIRRRDADFNVVEHAFRAAGLPDDVTFSGSGKSFVIAGVEHGLHGDLGVGGSRGSPQQFRRLGPKVTSAHTHSPMIADGVYVAGVSARLFQGYNKGPTTWAHAHVVLYANGKRCLLTMTSDGRWRAGMKRKELHPRVRRAA